jgi:hypothetical protein
MFQFAIVKKRVSSTLAYAQTDDGAQSSYVEDLKKLKMTLESYISRDA